IRATLSQHRPRDRMVTATDGVRKERMRIEIAREGSLADRTLVGHVTSEVGPMPAERLVRAADVTGATIDPEAWPTRAFLSVADALGRYHRHRVVNLERLGRL